MSPEPKKRCSGCFMVQPATPKYFWRSKYERDGLRKRCKFCCLGTPGYIARADRHREQVTA